MFRKNVKFHCHLACFIQGFTNIVNWLTNKSILLRDCFSKTIPVCFFYVGKLCNPAAFQIIEKIIAAKDFDVKSFKVFLRSVFKNNANALLLFIKTAKKKNQGEANYLFHAKTPVQCCHLYIFSYCKGAVIVSFFTGDGCWVDFTSMAGS